MSLQKILTFSLGAALAIGGLAILATTPAQAAPAFDHVLHIDQGLECQTCHMPGDESEPILPTITVCGDCHDDGEVALPIRKAASGEVDWSFSHDFHIDDVGLECADCHQGVIDGKVSKSGRWSPGMHSCQSCHRDNGVEQVCADCHSRLDKDVRPGPQDSVLLDHTVSWNLRHGEIARASDELCSYCHETPKDCISCHLDIPPRSHNRLFKIKTHGIEAEIDRDNCQSCHIQQDFCSVCHEQVKPRSHSAGFGNPSNVHCDTCHEPLADTTCYTCHKTLDAHFTTPPADHTGGWGDPVNAHCNSCHLPLADTTCFTCHKDTASHDQPPQSHIPAWGDPTNVHCNTCHLPLADTTCSVCHDNLASHEEPPSSHTASWGETQNQHCFSCHEPLADTDCAVCHDNNASHQTVPPAATHTPSWGDPVNAHCDSCHLPLASTTCATCHDDLRSHDQPPGSHRGNWEVNHCSECHFPIEDTTCGVCHRRDPEHSFAPQMPPWHSPDMDCMVCHPSQVPINHPIPEEDCTTCHRPS